MRVLVSVVCNAYNHENYIREALEGFVNQIVDFTYEVIVNDDASTDGTADIIREYEQKYPHLIKPIYQKENRYSKGYHVLQETMDQAVGKYIAVCEGDDYWTDMYKLQKQVDYMESHPECTFCFTNGMLRYGNQINETNPAIPMNRYAVVKRDSADYDAAELDLLDYIPTASIMFPRDLKPFQMPKGAFLGDVYLRLWATSYGYAHFIDEPTCVYRRAVSGSATVVMVQSAQKLAAHCDQMLLLYQGLKENLPRKYENVFNMRICQWKISKACTLEDYAELKRIRNSGEIALLKYGNRYSWILYTMQCCFPHLHSRLRTFAKKLLKSLNR